MTPEGKIKNKIKKYLDSLGPRCFWFMPMNFGYGKVGVPDFIICYRGRFIALETKKPGGKNEAWQEQRQQEISTARGVAKRVDNLDEVIEIISQIDRGIHVV